jgi:hypothetical protein
MAAAEIEEMTKRRRFMGALPFAATARNAAVRCEYAF